MVSAPPMARTDDTKRIRKAVFARAHGRCECGCGRWITEETGRLDTSSGERKSPSNSRPLAIECDEAKTASKPCAAVWLQRFAFHCGTHGYLAERELALAKLNFLTVKKLVRR